MAVADSGFSGDCRKSTFDEEFEISHYCNDNTDKFFADVIGCIENTVISSEFLQIQSEFMEKHWEQFEEGEENKLVYTEIFLKYQAIIEKYIEKELVKNISNFDMELFEKELINQSNNLDEEIYEMLSSFWDFSTFKRMFLEYRKMKEGQGIDFSKDILVTKYSV